ncbi:MAG TPA: long-chain fatty acid--CoA ligase [Caldithrix abyssi]|uniref:Long-chain fatty acid--CoA ligase n=1 Tax=Caldithrix abyssi TaxID=187145 RepID=A0A7V5PQB0_CALAY|nr:long-chain fatty acid--CoA ligase [Caldithrix abyssi]
MEPLQKYTLKDLLERSAKNFPLTPALANLKGEKITYAIFYNRVQTVVRFLQNQGIAPGDKVALVSENMINWPIAYFAVTSMGAVVVPILPDFHINEIKHIIRHAECKAVFCSGRFVDEIVEMKPRELLVIRLEDFKQVEQGKKDILQDILDWGEEGLDKMKKTAQELVGKKKSQQANIPDEHDLAAIIYTSGTTGNSKGVMLTHRNIVFDAVSTKKIITLTPEDRLLSILPLAHTYECTIGLVTPLMYGACIYYLDRPPTPMILVSALAKVRPTVMLSVPLVIEKIFKKRIQPEFHKNKFIELLYTRIPVIRKRLHKLAGKKLRKTFGGRLRFFGIGGAPLSPEVEAFLIEADFPYAIGYGLTETSPLVAGMGPQMRKFRSTGPALDGVEIKIHEPNPETGEGEIWVRGDNVMLGYYKDPDRTREVLTEDGWFKTGDLAYMDEDGYLFIKGRSKNVIVGPSGENIYPEQIEAVLNEFDCVLEALVYENQGKLVAKVYLDYDVLDERFHVKKLTEKEVREKVAARLEEIRQQVNQRVSSFSRLQKIVEQTKPFERTPTQKIKRFLYVNEALE